MQVPKEPSKKDVPSPDCIPASLSSSVFQYNKDLSFFFPFSFLKFLDAERFECLRQAASMVSDPGSSVQVVALACHSIALEILMRRWADQQTNKNKDKTEFIERRGWSANGVWALCWLLGNV